MRALLLLSTLAACWTGATRDEAPVPSVAPVEKATTYLRVRLERTPCMGDCPSFAIEIDGTRRVARVSSAEDADSSARVVRIGAQDMRALDRAIVASRFFDRDERGNLPIEPACTHDGSTTTCSLGATISICSDTSHAILAVSRGIRSHTIDYDFCNDNPELVELTRLVEQIARVKGPADE